jgi:drug/metabolite transporter (DMT)-like permease
MGLCGVYFSLQYLSLSDATVLTFLIPTFTGFSGALFLKEPFSLRELLAGCTYATLSMVSNLPEGSIQLGWSHVDCAAAVPIR